MKPLLRPLVPGPGHRTPQTMLLLDERSKLLISIAARFYPGVSHRETAHLLRRRWLLYRQGPWRRTCAEFTCPHDPERLEAALWGLLRARDYVPSTMTIRRALAYS